MELLKANISGRVWDDRNYDGLQATKTVTVDGKETTVVDTDAEPGIEGEEVRLSQWMYVPVDKWAQFVANHEVLPPEPARPRCSRQPRGLHRPGRVDPQYPVR